MVSNISIEIVDCENIFEVHVIKDGEVVYRSWAKDILEAGEQCIQIRYFFSYYKGNGY